MNKPAKSPIYRVLLLASLMGAWAYTEPAFSWPADEFFEQVKSATRAESIDVSIHPFIEKDSFSLLNLNELLLQRVERGELGLKDALTSILSAHIPQDLSDAKVKINYSPKWLKAHPEAESTAQQLPR